MRQAVEIQHRNKTHNTSRSLLNDTVEIKVNTADEEGMRDTFCHS